MSSPSSWCSRLWRRKVLDASELGSSKLDRCLSTVDLTALGIGATLGVGIYVLSGSVSKEVAGPSVVISFLIAGLASALSGLCYAELGARVPKAGSAYVYSYVTVGELVAFVIGWNLVLEYAIGAASVSRAYSGYLDSLLNKTMQKALTESLPLHVPHLSPYPDLCAMLLAFVLTAILSFGVKESTKFNNVFTCLNLVVVSIVTFGGLLKSDLRNWFLPKGALPTDAAAGDGGFFPFGFSGTLSGAATCFYGYVGFDSIATSGEETKKPQRSIPISIGLSLFVVFLAYFGVSSALTLMVPYYMQDPDAPLPTAFKLVGLDIVGHIVSIGALFGLSTSLLGCMFPLPRVIYAMASDGLIFRSLADVNSTFQTPLKATVLAGVFVGLTAALFELKSLVDMMSIGTLMAYTIVCASVILLRFQDIPGLDNVQDYFPLEMSNEMNILNSESDDGDESEEIVYCRSADLDDSKTMHPRLGLTFRAIVSGLLNPDRASAPTEVSSFVSSGLTVIYSVSAVILAMILTHLDGEMAKLTMVTGVSLGIVVFVMTLSLLFLCLQPRTTQAFGFRVPLVPLLPAVAILVNVYLMLKLSIQTWVRFIVWLAVGFVIYFGYGIRNSSEEVGKGRRLSSKKVASNGL